MVARRPVDPSERAELMSSRRVQAVAGVWKEQVKKASEVEVSTLGTNPARTSLTHSPLSLSHTHSPLTLSLTHSPLSLSLSHSPLTHTHT